RDLPHNRLKNGKRRQRVHVGADGMSCWPGDGLIQPGTVHGVEQLDSCWVHEGDGAEVNADFDWASKRRCRPNVVVRGRTSQLKTRWDDWAAALGRESR